MKLGTETNSLTNHIYSRSTIGQPDATVGMGATILCWTDRHGATVIEVGKSAGRTLLTVQEDTATRADKNGMSESQDYAFAPNPNGRRYTFRQTKTGGWDEVHLNTDTGRYNKTSGPGLLLGRRDHYHDFSF